MIWLMALFAAALALASCNQTLETGKMMSTQGYAFAPPAFYPFCSKEPRLCSTTGGTKLVKLTPRRQAELASVNSSVNSRIGERSDIASSGRADIWRVPTKVGDCEDFAILKKSELLKRGWPASALLLTVATLGGGGAHGSDRSNGQGRPGHGQPQQRGQGLVAIPPIAISPGSPSPKTASGRESGHRRLRHCRLRGRCRTRRKARLGSQSFKASSLQAILTC